ncbi:MAG TPA: DUF3854 domain-containing protein, partial [Urbifossiella sp.]|nr:DUF3854 domain-containing protein [Urbifossiella sp.]
MTPAPEGDPGAAAPAATADPGPGLLPHHRAALLALGLDDEAIAANGIYSESDPAAAGRLLNQKEPSPSLVPALVFPYFDRDGRPLGHVALKPDSPRYSVIRGSTRYEHPAQRRHRLYIPAGARAAVADPAAPLVVTSSCTAALAATRAGHPCVGAFELWSDIRRRRKKTGQTVLRTAANTDFTTFPWAGRRVLLAYDIDSDSTEQKFAAALRMFSADVAVVTLPPAPDGGKTGLDDCLLRHGPEGLRQLLAEPDRVPLVRKKPADSALFTAGGYMTHRGSTYHGVLDRHPFSGKLVVERQARLANFTARIVGETVTDDGAEPAREFAIAVEWAGRPPVTVDVPVDRFRTLSWVADRLGPGYVVQAGKRDHLRCAIQELSPDPVPTTTVFAHTGWREVGGHWQYLHAGGAVAAAGAGDSPRVRLDGPAARFRLPDPPTGDELQAAVRASLGLLDGLAPDTVT